MLLHNPRDGASIQRLKLLSHAAPPHALASLAIAGAIETGHAHGLAPAKWLRGLSGEEFAALLDSLFPGARARWPDICCGPAAADELDAEFGDLLQLLMEAADPPGRQAHWLACAIASAALFDHHLWQDLQLPDRKTLSHLLTTHFGALARRNTANMRWKAFFYKQICERAGMVCRAPSCGACDDYAECFGAE